MFESSRLKIKRANQHVLDFQGVLNIFLKTNFYTFGIEHKADTGQDILQFKMTREAPEDLPLILGDAIHNLRAALDLAYVELITRVGKEPSKWTTLRVYENRQKLVDTLSQGILQGAPDVVAMLADTIKAYEGGDSLLTALDCLDISDKHVLLVPVFTAVALVGFDAEVTMPGGGGMSMNNCTVNVGQGGVLNMAAFGAGATFKLKGQGKPAIAVLFGKDTALEAKPVIPTLTQFSQLVGNTIQTFENALAIRDAQKKV
jgi:hypothetical protein